MNTFRNEQSNLTKDIHQYLVKQNGNATARDPIVSNMNQLGLKLPLNPKTMKGGPKGEILVQKGLDEQWNGQYGGYFLYGGLHGKRVIGKDGHEI